MSKEQTSCLFCPKKFKVEIGTKNPRLAVIWHMKDDHRIELQTLKGALDYV